MLDDNYLYTFQYTWIVWNELYIWYFFQKKKESNHCMKKKAFFLSVDIGHLKQWPKVEILISFFFQLWRGAFDGGGDDDDDDDLY